MTTSEPLARAARAVAFALTDAQVYAESIDVRRGPRLACIDVSLAHATDIDRVLRMGRTFAAACDVWRVRLAETARGVAVEVPLPRAMWRGVGLPFRMRAVPGDLLVMVGENARGAAVGLDFADPSTPHLFAVGATGSGKTTALQAIVWQFVAWNNPERLALVLIDGLASGLAPFADVPHLALPLAATPAAGAAAIAAVCAELDARIADPTRRVPLVVVVDELAQVTNGNDAAGAGLARIAATGRGLGVHAILATQHATANVVSRLVSANITTRLVGKVADAAASRLAMGSDRDDARTLAGAGDMLLCRGDDVRRVQVPVVTADEWAMLPTGPRVHALDVTRVETILSGGPAGRPDADAVSVVAGLWTVAGPPGIHAIRRAIGCGDSRARRLRDEAAERRGGPGGTGSRGDALTSAHVGATARREG